MKLGNKASGDLLPTIVALILIFYGISTATSKDSSTLWVIGGWIFALAGIAVIVSNFFFKKE